MKRDLELARALCEGSKQPIAEIFLEAMRWRNVPFEDLERVLSTSRHEAAYDLKRGLWMIGTIGSLAPYVGLFGTVVGIIRAFADMAEHGAGGFEVVAAGISEALIATAMGLAVAIIALMFFNYLQTRVGLIASAYARSCERFVQALLFLESSAARESAVPGPEMVHASYRPDDDDDLDDGVVAEINITPLTDVFLVLLVIFMVTTSVVANQGKNIDLPGAEISDQTPRGVTVEVTPDGQIAVNDVASAQRGSVSGALRCSPELAREGRDPARRPGRIARSGRQHPRRRTAGGSAEHRARHQAAAGSADFVGAPTAHTPDPARCPRDPRASRPSPARTANRAGR